MTGGTFFSSGGRQNKRKNISNYRAFTRDINFPILGNCLVPIYVLSMDLFATLYSCPLVRDF